MAEIKTKNLVINVGGKSYKMIGSRLEDICKELEISEDRFIELLSRDAYCPTLSAAPTSSTLTYIDTDGSANHFHVGQLCRWAVGNDYRIAVCKDITETNSAWYTLPTKVSELTNDSGYLTSHQDISHLLPKTEAESTYQKKGDYATKTDVSTAIADLVGEAPETLDTIEELSAALKNNADVVDVINESIASKQDKVLKFENVTASNWVTDSTYSDFGYHCDLTCTGATGAMFAEVVFSQADAVSGDYAMVCETMTNVVRIYSKKNVSITVPTIIIHK